MRQMQITNLTNLSYKEVLKKSKKKALRGARDSFRGRKF